MFLKNSTIPPKHKARQISKKNKFFLAGTYQATSGSEIQLNAMNIPQGSVKVSSGGIALVEGAGLYG